MKSFRLSYALTLACFAILLAGVANAQATRTWVSGVGDDANPCSRTAPCKTFAGAIAKTASAGEINCLDPAGFGAVTITKSITIDCSGTIGGVLASGTNGIVITDGNAFTIVVTLRGLDINGNGSGGKGVSLISAKSLHVERSSIYGFTTSCVDVSNGPSQFTVEDSTLSECGTNGISANGPGTAQIWGVINNTRIFNVTNGVNAQNGTRLNIRRSNIFVATVAINQTGVGAGASGVLVTDSTISLCGTALQSIAGGNIMASANTFFSDGTIFNANGGSIITGADNLPDGGTQGVANGGTQTKM